MSKKLFSKFFVLLLVVGLLFAVAPTGQAQAATLDVCPTCTYTTIQAAVAASAAGDVINVAAGTYDIGTLVIPHPLSIIGAGDTTLVNGKFQLTNAGSVAGTYLFQTMKFPVTNSSITVTDFGHVIDEVKVDNVTFDTNMDRTARAVGVGADSTEYRIGKFTVINSRFYSTLAIYLDGDIGEILIQNNEFHITDWHWSGQTYNAININQSKPASGSVNTTGQYKIENNQLFVPSTNPYSSAITNQAYPGSALAGQPGGKELSATGNTLTVAPSTVITDQSLFVKDQIAVTNALFPVHNVTQHTYFATIQPAIDATSTVAGDVIEVGPGTYAGSLNINKGVTLRAVDLIETVFIGDTAAPGVWSPDRYRPAVFQSATWEGREAIQHGVRVADSEANRPAGYSGTFYNTQGRQYQTSLSGDVQRMSIDMWVDASWATNQAYAGLWSVGKNASGVVSSYPIIAWRSTTGATPGFYIWDFSGWQLVKAAEASDYGKWHTLAIELRAGVGVQYYLDGQPAGAFLADTDTVSLGNVILNVYNYGLDYDVYWDNFSTAGVSIVGQATVNASNVSIDGFNISNPEANFGVLVNPGFSNVTITGNTFENIGGTAFADNVKGIYLLSGPDHVTIEGNVFRNIHAGTKSVNGVFSGDSTATDAAEFLVIRNNVFEDITSATKGGYGILLNNGTGNPGVIIEGNSFNGISGGWTHAIGLEGPTPNALVNRNTFSGLTAGSADNTAVFFEANSGLATTNITNNQFLNAGFGVAVHPNMAPHPTVLATPNWWGQLTGPAAGQLPTGDYDTSPWCANAECTEFLPDPLPIKIYLPLIYR